MSARGTAIDQMTILINNVTPRYGLIGKIIGANFNSTADQVFSLSTGIARYSPDVIQATNVSTSMTTAAGGVYNTASKGGTPIVAATQVYTALTGATKVLALTVAVTDTNTVPLIFSLTTGHGSAATADLYIWGYIYA